MKRSAEPAAAPAERAAPDAAGAGHDACPGDAAQAGAHRFRQAPAAHRRAARSRARLSRSRSGTARHPVYPGSRRWRRHAAAFGGGATLSRYDLKTRKLEKLADGIASFDLSANGEKMLLRMAPAGGAAAVADAAPPPPAAPQYFIVPPRAPVKPGEGALTLADVEVNVDPIAEWKQMYHEVWRIERSYFYDPNLHGVNVADSEKEYEKYLDSLGSRSDLNYIFQDMLSEMTVGHLRGGGGNLPQARTVPGGLLGADYEIANGRYRIQADLHRRELEPAVAGAARRARPEYQPGRLPARRSTARNSRPRTTSRGCSKNTAGKRIADPRRSRPVGREFARDDGGAGRQRAGSSATRRGSRPTAARSTS